MIISCSNRVRGLVSASIGREGFHGEILRSFTSELRVSNENIRLFLASTAVAVGLAIWGILATEKNLNTILLCTQLAVVLVLGIIAVSLAIRIRNDRTRFGIRRLISERQRGVDFNYEYSPTTCNEVILVGIIHRVLWADKTRFEITLESAVRQG